MIPEFRCALSITLLVVGVFGLELFLLVLFCFKISKNAKIKKNDKQNYETNRIFGDGIEMLLNPNKNIDIYNTDKGKNDKDLNENIEFKTFEEKD